MNERLKYESNNNNEMLTKLINKLDKVNKEIENRLNDIKSRIINNIFKDKSYELEQVKLSLELNLKIDDI